MCVNSQVILQGSTVLWNKKDYGTQLHFNLKQVNDIVETNRYHNYALAVFYVNMLLLNTYNF